jgi:hypothetical protein
MMKKEEEGRNHVVQGMQVEIPICLVRISLR